MKNILIVGSQHGNELLGEQLYRYISKHYRRVLKHLTFVIGNPLAYSQGKRYVESDMNRSYGDELVTYEDYMARGLLIHIQRSNYDLVIDMHTTRCMQPPSIIVAPNCNDEVRSFIQATCITNIVIMGHFIVRSSLIGNAPQSLSIEIQQDTVDDDTLQQLAKNIYRYMNDEKVAKRHEIYFIYDLIKKVEVLPEQARLLRNFTRCEDGYYPILVGNNSYRKNTEHLGFKARRARHLSIDKIGYNER